MALIKTQTLKTDNQGNTKLDVNELEPDTYTAIITYSGDTLHQTSTSTKNFKITKGYDTRIKAYKCTKNNNTGLETIIEELDDEDIVTGNYYDNTYIKLKLQYYDTDLEKWVDKENYELNITYTNSNITNTTTITNTNNTLNLSKEDAGDYDINIEYLGQGINQYLESNLQLTYTQSENTPIITNTNSTIIVYGEENITLRPTLVTPEGNPLPNKQINMVKNSVNYTSTTDTKGEAIFTTRVSPETTTDFNDNTPSDDNLDEYYTVVDNTANTMSDIMHFYMWNGQPRANYFIHNNLGKWKITNISTLNEKVLEIQQQVIGNYNLILDCDGVEFKIKFTNNAILIEDSLTFNYNTNNLTKNVKIVIDNNILKIYEHDQFICPITLPDTVTDYYFQGENIYIFNIKVSTVTEPISAERTLTFSFNGDNNLNAATDVTSELTINEYAADTSLEYLIDGYGTSKAYYIDSTISINWEEDQELEAETYGYTYDGTQYTLPDSFNLTNHTITGNITNTEGLTLYRKLENHAYSLLKVNETIGITSWTIEENNTKTGWNPHLTPSEVTISETIDQNFKLYLGIKNATVRIRYNNQNGVEEGYAVLTTDNSGYTNFNARLFYTAGNQTLKAIFDGNDDFQAQTITANIIQGTPDIEEEIPTTSDVTSITLNGTTPITKGNNYSLTCVVTGSNNTAPTGTIQLYKDGSSTPISPTSTTTVGTTQLKAVFSISSSSDTTGNHTFTASYGGDTNYNSATSTSKTIKVNAPVEVTTPTSTSTTLSAPTGNIGYGESGTISASVSPSSAVGTLTVVNEATGTVWYTSTSGSINETYTADEVGKTVQLKAYFTPSNSNNYSSSSSATKTCTIVKGEIPTLSLVASKEKVYTNDTYFFVATLRPHTGKTATGNVKLYFQSTSNTARWEHSVSGSGGIVSTDTYTASHSSAGTFTFYLVYSGDTNYNSKTVSCTIQGVVS